ncbi:MAG TPA: SCO family protein [Persephonella sp.]|uniref:Electron transport protein SCO1/SenC n=1 Tax=Persephonella marina (strain DSM 14350 / EX-H1) TaxID=123214 RepID=C0QQU2_PERMH|nr:MULTISPECIES: SCO family protein [Persephonella]ACO03102.1 electron transport protein SCO1/SenC [Persephonella marina EX-H1]HCB68788.1 SCO family protein [Persephonella sp.]
MKKLITLLSVLIFVTLSLSYQFYGLPYLQKIKDFTLTDHNGKKVKLSDFKDKIVLVFFGYTFCPDVCPATMLRIKETLDNLGDYKKYVKVLFISVDPERDTPEKLKEYVKFYDKDGTIIGLTGKPEEIKKVAKSFRAFYEKVPVKDNPDVEYLMDHTAFIYLLDNRGILKLIYTPRKDNPKRIAEDIIQMVKLLKMEK